jgi:hypothetical protein
MAVISITIVESETQIVSGIPKTVSISTNIPASIFYTLDGSTPSLFSTMYTSPVFLPIDALSVTLNIMATNGVDTSPIISETYITNMAEGTNARLPRSSTDAAAGSNIPGLYPFGTNPIQPNADFINPADAGITVDNPALPATSTGFDGAGNPVGFTNQTYDSTNYSIRYSTTDAEGQVGLGIGNLPATATIKQEIPAPEFTNQNSNMFDPRAFVIFQDASTENPDDPPHINRMHFSLENPEKARDGNAFFTSGLDAPPVSGTFLRSHYNPRTNNITYYYLDTWTNRWIISTMPYRPNTNWDGNLSVMAPGRNSRFVFEWQNFPRRVLF